MAVTQQVKGVGTLAAPYYAGLSEDQRPLPTEEEATFAEVDTGRVYVWRDRTWHLWVRPQGEAVAAIEAATSSVLVELRKITGFLAAVAGGPIIDTGE